MLTGMRNRARHTRAHRAGGVAGGDMLNAMTLGFQASRYCVNDTVSICSDPLDPHHSKPVMTWLEEHKDRIEVFYLPSYSPELNSDERLNAVLKHVITTSVPKRTRQGLRQKTEEHMTMVASTPERVKSYFKDKHVSYAAESM